MRAQYGSFRMLDGALARGACELYAEVGDGLNR
jgi:hypothetical protein